MIPTLRSDVQQLRREPIFRRIHALEFENRSDCQIGDPHIGMRLYRDNAAGPLIEAERDGLITEYRYDPNGNRTAVLVDGIETVTASYDAQDRILRHGTQEYAASAHGDLLRRTDGMSALELSYDELGNLLRAFGSDGSDGQDATTIDYLVDGFGRRIAKRVGGQFSRAWLYQDQPRPAP